MWWGWWHVRGWSSLAAMVAMLCLQLCVARQPHSCLIAWLVTVAALTVAAVFWMQHVARMLGINPPSAWDRSTSQDRLPHGEQLAATTKVFRLNGRRYDGKRFRGWHVREAPSALAKPVAQLKDGDEVEVSEVRVGGGRVQGDWLLLADGRGWLRKEHDGAAWCQVDAHGRLVADRWSAEPPKRETRLHPSASSTVAAAHPAPATTVRPSEKQDEGRSALNLSSNGIARDAAASTVPRQLPQFTYCKEMQALAKEAVDYAPGFLADSQWELSPSPRPSAVTWRMPSSPFLGSPIRPFKARGVVKGVEPVVLATMFLGLALKWPERKLKVRKKKQEVRRVEQVDWSTTLWFEHEKIPVPLVADREVLYLETIRHCSADSTSNGGHDDVSDESSDDELFMVVRKSVEKDDLSVAPGRVRGLSYVVMTFRRDPDRQGTEQTLAMDFDIKGRIPGRAVDGFLAQQAGLFDKLTKFVGSQDGQSMIEHVKKKIPEDRLHSSHPMHGKPL